MMDELMEIAEAAAKINKELGLTTEEIIKKLLDGIYRIPNVLQASIYVIVAMQEEWPMPSEGWDAFKKDIEYTNQKYGFNLQIPETGKEV